MTALAILFGISQVARRWGMPSDCLKTSAYRGEGRRWWKNHGKTMERWWWWRWCWWWWWWWCRIFLFRSVMSVELSRDAGKKQHSEVRFQLETRTMKHTSTSRAGRQLWTSFSFQKSCHLPYDSMLQVENNECGLPCFGTQVESKAVEAKPECLKLKQAGHGVPHGFLRWIGF